MNPSKTVHIQYYAILREERGLKEETCVTQVRTAENLFNELKEKFHFRLPMNALRVSINGQFSDWQTTIQDQDKIVFIPPVAGG